MSTTAASYTVSSNCAITDNATWTMNHTPTDKYTVSSRVTRSLDAIRTARLRYRDDLVPDVIIAHLAALGDEDTPSIRPPTFDQLADANCLDTLTVRNACARLLVHRLLSVGWNPRTGDTVIRLTVPDRLPAAAA